MHDSVFSNLILQAPYSMEPTRKPLRQTALCVLSDDTCEDISREPPLCRRVSPVIEPTGDAQLGHPLDNSLRNIVQACLRMLRIAFAVCKGTPSR